jgi:hypothetical protein
MLRANEYNLSTNSYQKVTKYVGRSMFVQSQTVQVMSDIWEDHMVLHSLGENGRINETSVGGWYGCKREDCLSFAIDVTEEAYEDYRKCVEEQYYENMVRTATAEAEDPAFKGRVVKVVSGRRHRGEIGRVVVVMDAYYGMGYHGYTTKKLGVATSPRTVDKVMPNGKVFQNHVDMIWVWAKNCEVEKPQAPNLEVIREEAKRLANQSVSSLKARAEANNTRYASYIKSKEAA